MGFFEMLHCKKAVLTNEVTEQEFVSFFVKKKKFYKFDEI